MIIRRLSIFTMLLASTWLYANDATSSTTPDEPVAKQDCAGRIMSTGHADEFPYFARALDILQERAARRIGDAIVTRVLQHGDAKWGAEDSEWQQAKTLITDQLASYEHDNGPLVKVNVANALGVVCTHISDADQQNLVNWLANPEARNQRRFFDAFLTPFLITPMLKDFPNDSAILALKKDAATATGRFGSDPSVTTWLAKSGQDPLMQALSKLGPYGRSMGEAAVSASMGNAMVAAQAMMVDHRDEVDKLYDGYKKRIAKSN